MRVNNIEETINSNGLKQFFCKGKIVLPVNSSYEENNVVSWSDIPIIISETEEIKSNEGMKMGDWVYNSKYNSLFQMNGDITGFDFKVLVFSEQFPENENLKVEDTVFIECERMYRDLVGYDYKLTDDLLKYDDNGFYKKRMFYQIKIVEGKAQVFKNKFAGNLKN